MVASYDRTPNRLLNYGAKEVKGVALFELLVSEDLTSSKHKLIDLRNDLDCKQHVDDASVLTLS